MSFNFQVFQFSISSCWSSPSSYFTFLSFVLSTILPVFCGASHSVVLPVLITRDACVDERVPSVVVFIFLGVYDVFRVLLCRVHGLFLIASIFFEFIFYVYPYILFIVYSEEQSFEVTFVSGSSWASTPFAATSWSSWVSWSLMSRGVVARGLGMGFLWAQCPLVVSCPARQCMPLLELLALMYLHVPLMYICIVAIVVVVVLVRETFAC